MNPLPVPTAPMLAAPTLAVGTLRKIHHIALNVQNMQAARQFYGTLLGLHELTGDAIPSTLKALVAPRQSAQLRHARRHGD